MEEYALADDSVLERNPAWDVEYIDWFDRPGMPRGLRRWSRIRRTAAAALFGVVQLPAFAKRALGRVHDELVNAASRVRPDLYIAHYLPALLVAESASRRTKAGIAFDAEDFHRGEFGAGLADRRERRLVEWVERHYIPRCRYVTAASDGIADAYAACLGIERPTTVLNVFSLTERESHVARELCEQERAADVRTLYWFSQIIGRGRGLEDAVDALAQLDPGVVLCIRGRWAAGYERELMARARMRGVANRVRTLPPVYPHELVALTARHDIGLALEPPRTINSTICLSNKLFTYLLAGIPVVATATDGQRRIAGELGSAVRLYQSGDSQDLAAAVRGLLTDTMARATAHRLASERFNWEVERDRFLQLVHAHVGPPSFLRASIPNCEPVVERP